VAAVIAAATPRFNSYDRAVKYVDLLIRHRRSACWWAARAPALSMAFRRRRYYLEDRHIADILTAVDTGFGLASGAVALRSIREP
jgi:hypothetical protein